METTAVAFLGNYLNSRLKDGMRKDDVHLAINRFLSSNSKCNTARPTGLRCCHANETL